MSFLKYYNIYEIFDFFFLLLIGVVWVYVNIQLVVSVNGVGYLVQDWGERVGIGSYKGDRFIVGVVDEVYIYMFVLIQI